MHSTRCNTNTNTNTNTKAHVLLTIKNIERHVCNLGLRPHATQHEGTRLPIKFNALFMIKNKKEKFVNAEKAYLRVRGGGVA